MGGGANPEDSSLVLFWSSVDVKSHREVHKQLSPAPATPTELWGDEEVLSECDQCLRCMEPGNTILWSVCEW